MATLCLSLAFVGRVQVLPSVSRTVKSLVEQPMAFLVCACTSVNERLIVQAEDSEARPSSAQT